ncbi:hypothetical protein NE237_018318 [Protea cynaroides]|uniref:non-specific serine/threonine protein kinase n=1 Tax=Protea cynaroides TaxID=273540 RepID=A0A9Q0K9Q1_9MAGN|nr:hypothetical protein NE237_018318 [Protea cynaroides]
MEKEILGILDHPFLPTLYVEFDASHSSRLVMELCPGGDLHASRQREPGKWLSSSSAKFYGAETLWALKHLHMVGVAYRDLKPENVMIREDEHIMLSDFDFSHSVQVVAPSAIRMNAIRCVVHRSGGDLVYSLFNSRSNFSDRVPTEMPPLFPSYDYEHPLIVMDKPGGICAYKQRMIDCYIQTLAKVLGNEEEPKKKIYNVSCVRYFGSKCEMDEELSIKLEGLSGVLFVLPDSYGDTENNDYGAELFVNGGFGSDSDEILSLNQEELQEGLYHLLSSFFGNNGLFDARSQAHQRSRLMPKRLCGSRLQRSYS